mgnify:FL=1
MSESSYQQLSALLPAGCVRENVTLAPYTTMRTGGPAALFAEPRNAQQLAHVHQWAQEKGLSLLILGNGSNLLIADSGFDGLVIHLGRALSEVSVFANTLTAQAGASLAAAARAAAQASLTGLEFAAGIPGSIGGAVCMNAGAYGGEIAQVIVSARLLTPEGVRTVSKDELSLGYRSSAVMQNGWVVLEATFELAPGSPDEIKATMADLAARRREKQPLQYPSCGSFFKRPVGYYAGALIEQAGLKGYRVGDAQVSEMHAGFVINRGHATSSEIYRLMQEVQCRVQAQFGVTLEPEVRLIGHFEA